MTADEPSPAYWVGLVAVVLIIWAWNHNAGKVHDLERDLTRERQRVEQVEQDFADLETAICELPFRNDLMRDIEMWINIIGPYDALGDPVVFNC